MTRVLLIQIPAIDTSTYSELKSYFDAVTDLYRKANSYNRKHVDNEISFQTQKHNYSLVIIQNVVPFCQQTSITFMY